MQVAVHTILDELPDVYGPELYDRKCELVFNHIFASYFDDGQSVYEEPGVIEAPAPPPAVPVESLDVERLTDELLERIQNDAQFADLVARQLRGESATWAGRIHEFLASDEHDQVEFKSTARWNLRDQCKDKRIEDAVVKTVAGFLNTSGGTLLIGVDDDGALLGLDADYACVKPPNGDGFVNWLTTHFTNAVGHTATMRVRIRIETCDGRDVCRVDVAESSVPVYARTSKEENIFFVRMNNSTRDMPDEEIEQYIRDHWPEHRGDA